MRSKRIGGRGRDRTGGLVVANDALSQLSYTPTCSTKNINRRWKGFQIRLRQLPRASAHERARVVGGS
jgi:hypothetical protein